MKKLASSLLLLSVLAVGVTGCTPQASPRNNAAQDPRAGVQNTASEDSTRLANVSSVGITVRNDLAQRLNMIPGFRNSTVLTSDGKTYVSLTRIGHEVNKDAAIKSGDNWKDMPYGTTDRPKSAAGMSVHELAAEGLPDATSHRGPYTTHTGNISDHDKQTIGAVIRSQLPNAPIFISTIHDDAAKLSGYRAYIARGGDMGPHLHEFREYVNRYFISLDNANKTGNGKAASNYSGNQAGTGNANPGASTGTNQGNTMSNRAGSSNGSSITRMNH